MENYISSQESYVSNDDDMPKDCLFYIDYCSRVNQSFDTFPDTVVSFPGPDIVSTAIRTPVWLEIDHNDHLVSIVCACENCVKVPLSERTKNCLNYLSKPDTKLYINSDYILCYNSKI